jgi:hypothetical protein
MSAISLTNSPLSATPSTSTTPWQAYFRERQPEILQLNKDLKAGDLTAAQHDYNNLVSLGNTVLHSKNPFVRSDRALDFDAIGGALQNGDLAGARQAFAALEKTFAHKLPPAATPSSPLPATAANLSDTTASGVNVIA